MNWDRLTLVTGPAATPISLPEAKAHLRVDDNDSDVYINQCIDRAVAAVDGPNGIGRCLMSQSWLLALDRFPETEFTIPLGPVQSITSIKYLDPSGIEQTLSAGNYWPSLNKNPVTIHPGYGLAWPFYRLMPGSVKVEFIAGTTVDKVPADIKAALLLLVGHYFFSREAVVVGDALRVNELPMGVEAILSRYRAGLVA